jgi:hypothetical protein
MLLCAAAPFPVEEDPKQRAPLPLFPALLLSFNFSISVALANSISLCLVKHVAEILQYSTFPFLLIYLIFALV